MTDLSKIRALVDEMERGQNLMKPKYSLAHTGHVGSLAIKALPALRSLLQSGEWQDISTAPKDGTAIAGYQKLTSRLWLIDIIYWNEDAWRVTQFHNENNEYEVKPTHWMSLPAPPPDGGDDE